jgi:stage II sporulation protein D
MGLEAFPVCRGNGTWQIWEGCYLSKEDARNAATNKIAPKIGAGSYTVAYPSDARIIVKYANGLAAIASESPFSFLAVKSTFQGDPKTVDVNGERFRNIIELRKHVDSNITVINELPLAEYLYGVVPLEIGTTDTPFEALKAQAVAARTYALNNKKHTDYGFDVCNSTCCQVYGGYDAENLATNNAIKATEGMVATYAGELAQLFYFASSGGATASSQNVWSSRIPYLQSVNDPYEDTRYWTYTFTAEEISRHLAQMGKDVGTVASVDVDQISDSGRVLKLRVTGSGGTVFFEKVNTRGVFPSYLPSQMFTVISGSGYTVRGAGNMLSSMSVAGAQVRTAFGTTTVVSNANVRVMDSSGRLVTVSTDSTANGNFSVSGAGHGHGVGMCQLGAIGMAGAGYTYEAILQHYFTGAQIEKAELR